MGLWRFMSWVIAIPTHVQGWGPGEGGDSAWSREKDAWLLGGPGVWWVWWIFCSSVLNVILEIMKTDNVRSRFCCERHVFLKVLQHRGAATWRHGDIRECVCAMSRLQDASSPCKEYPRITTMGNNSSSSQYPPLGFFFLGSVYRKSAFVVCGVSLSSLKPSRASGSGMWRMEFPSIQRWHQMLFFFFLKRTTKNVNIIYQKAQRTRYPRTRSADEKLQRVQIYFWYITLTDYICSAVVVHDSVSIGVPFPSHQQQTLRHSSQIFTSMSQLPVYCAACIVECMSGQHPTLCGDDLKFPLTKFTG